MLDLLVVVAIGYGIFKLIGAMTARVRRDRQSEATSAASAGSDLTKHSAATPIPVPSHPANPVRTTDTTPTPARMRPPHVDFRGPAQWIPAGQPVEIHGYSIPGGMLYVGSKLPSVSTASIPDPALIDPTRPVRRLPRGWPPPQLAYWPSYSEIPPEARGAYLEWLAGGRKDEIDIGYVFLFFYGLERRVLLDRLRSPGHSQVTDEEVARIADEVRRLLALYGDNGSFHRYATNFLDVCEFLLGRIDVEKAPELVEFGRWDPPMALRLGLGTRVAEGKPIPADWAFAWLHCDPEFRPRTPALRCKEEFRALFTIRYKERFGEGLVIRPNKTKLTIQYQPASATFAGQVLRLWSLDIPDVTALRAPLGKIRQLAEECTDELDPYSRWLARRDADENPIAGIGLLPRELHGHVQSKELQAFFAPVEAALRDREVAILDAEVLLKGWPTTSTGKLRKRDAVLLADLLAVRGFGMAPDIRFDRESPTVPGKVAVFRGDPAMPSAPSLEYSSGALLIRFAVSLALADGEVSGSEAEQIRQMIARLRLEPAEELRLRAYLEWLLSKGVSPSWKTQLDNLPADRQRAIADFLLSVAVADGKVSKTEINTLRKMYAALGLGEEQLYSDLHARTASSIPATTEPVLVAPAEPGPTYRIPPGPAASSVQLDMERVQRKMIETAQVAELLRSVFSDEEEVSLPTTYPVTARSTEQPGEPTSPVSRTRPLNGSADVATEAGYETGKVDVPAMDGLEPAHLRFLQRLAQRSSWSRAELERVADEYGLLLDGALELINDVAYERYSGPLVEGDDPIQVDEVCLKELIGGRNIDANVGGRR